MRNRKLIIRLKNLYLKIKAFFGKFGSLDWVLIVVGAFFIWFNWQMLSLYRRFQSIPEAYAIAVITATIGECGICGLITVSKIKRQEQKWKKEDKEEEEG